MEVERGQGCSLPVVYVSGDKFKSMKRAWYRVDIESLQSQSQSQVEGMGMDPIEKRRKKVIQPRFWASMEKRPMYRWVFVTKPKYPRVKIDTFAELDRCSIDGSCSLIDEDIYWLGRSSASTLDLIKHNINNNWETLSTIKNLSFLLSKPSFVAPVGRKVYVWRLIGKKKDQKLNLRGKIYDLDSNTWENLKCNSIYHTSYDVFSYDAALVEDETIFVFYSLLKGSLLFFDLTSRELRHDENHSFLSLWRRRKCARFTPPGLEEACDSSAIDNLLYATTHVPAMLSNYTLYWFTLDLYLYGYDINLRRWFQSPFLGNQLPTLTPLDCSDEEAYWLTPLLVDLRNGKYLAIVPEAQGIFTVALLTVVKNENSLSVSVESFHPLSADDSSFIPSVAKAMLKNTRSGAMHGSVRSARVT